MPRDIQVFIEIKRHGQWELAQPMRENEHYNHDDPKQNQLNEEMYINQYYPEEIYSEYDPNFWQNLGVEGRFSNKLNGLPKDMCNEIHTHHKSFGNEAFDENWLSCEKFIENIKENYPDVYESTLIKKIKKIGNPSDMRLILWFSQ